MQKLSTAEVRERLADVVNEAAFGNKTTIIERRGKGVAAIVPMTVIEQMIQVQAGVPTTWAVEGTRNAQRVHESDQILATEDEEREKETA